MKTILVIIIASVSGLFLLVEVGLRSLFGFGNPLLYITDEQIGYLLSPNQKTRRFGNRIEINQYSMRGEVIQQTRPSSTLRVFLIGDSIANGGWWTDQENTISSLLRESLLSAKLNNTDKVEVLNASANSWGPRNELAYLKRFGTFQAQVVVLIINTDDLFATAPTSLPVGRDRNYPDHKPPLAILEVIQRYVLKPQPIPEMTAVYQEGGDRVGVNLTAISEIHDLVKENQSQFLLVMTPLIRELEEKGSRDYEIQARQRLVEFTQKQKINYIDFLPILQKETDAKSFYHDHIHLNLRGNQLVTKTIENKLLETL
ncbi:SGNH/GDSL hydrolase family protein [Calothrix sp. 336/3]|uniref:SGNH/GDSL hydrolase family protein n=1 Tax=Calothrix sp. 336/3 TaxID=1337936 RepID=UPI0004E387E8|nr:SGNH/GDSL hydrolase family protein [Calothrix sp. 336/3]AKG23448.1 lipolytic protein G-D-S-L family [Calothrix sp. 336/3]